MPNCYSVADHGALPGDPASLAAALESIHAAILADRPRPDVPYPCEVRFPPGLWIADRPIWQDVSGMSICGAGPGITRIEAARGYVGDILLAGIPRVPVVGQTPMPLSADHWADTSGLFDASVPRSVGFRTKADAHLAFQATPFDAGCDQWASMAEFTLDLALVHPDGVMRPGVYLAIGSVEDGPTLKVDCWYPGVYRVELTAVSGGREQLLSWSFPAPSDGPLHRLAIQVSLTGAYADFWGNGSRLSATSGPDRLAFAPTVARAVRRNETLPLLVGGYSEQDSQAGNAAAGFGKGGPDFTLAALCLTSKPRYAVAMPTLARIDGKPMTDHNTFFDGFHPGCLALIPFDQPGVVKDASGRLIRYRCGGSWDYGYGQAVPNDVIASEQGDWTKDIAVRDLTVAHVDGVKLGRAIALGLANHVHLSNLELLGGYHGLGAWNVNATYPVRFRAGRLRGSDAGLSTYGAILRASDLDFLGGGRHACRLNGDAILRDCDAWDGAASRSVIRVHSSGYASRQVIEGFGSDGEANPPDYFLDADLSPGPQTDNSITLEDCLAARVAKAPYRLTAGGTDPNNWRPGTLAVVRFRMQNPPPSPGVIEPAGMWVVDEKVMTPAIGGQS